MSRPFGIRSRVNFPPVSSFIKPQGRVKGTQVRVFPGYRRLKKRGPEGSIVIPALRSDLLSLDSPLSFPNAPRLSFPLGVDVFGSPAELVTGHFGKANPPDINPAPVLKIRKHP